MCLREKKSAQIREILISEISFWGRNDLLIRTFPKYI